MAHVAGTEAAEVALMTALQPIRTPNGSESQLVQCEWRETKDTLLPIRAAVGRVYLKMHSGGGRSS